MMSSCFQKFLTGNPTVWIQIRSDVLSGMLLATTLARTLKELKNYAQHGTIEL